MGGRPLQRVEGKACVKHLVDELVLDHHVPDRHVQDVRLGSIVRRLSV